MARLSAALAASWVDETAIIDDDGSVTWHAFDECVNRCLTPAALPHQPGALPGAEVVRLPRLVPTHRNRQAHRASVARPALGGPPAADPGVGGD